MWAEFDPRRTLMESVFNLERLFIKELINMVALFINLNCTVIGQLHTLQERAPNTPETFRAVSSSGFSKAVACLSDAANSRLAIASELKKIPEEQSVL
jgi:hypothetical protein